MGTRVDELHDYIEQHVDNGEFDIDVLEGLIDDALGEEWSAGFAAGVRSYTDRGKS